MNKYLVINLLILFLVLSSGCQTSPETIEPSPVTMPIATIASTATSEPSPTATEVVLTLDQQVDAFVKGKIEFPSNLSPEEYSAFIDGMNDKVGRQPIWVEGLNSKTGAKVVLYFDVTKNRMVDLPGGYAENKAIIDQNVLEIFVKVNVEPGTGNIQFINSSGELVTSPNSAGTDWNLRVDDTNYKDGLIELPTVKDPKSPDNWWDKVVGGISEFPHITAVRKTLIPGILMDNTVSNVVSRQGGWNQYPCLDIMFVRTDKAGNPTYGVRVMVGPSPSTYMGYEGGTIDLKPGKYELRDSDTIAEFEAGAVYYVGIPENQRGIWDDSNKADIDELQGTGSEDSSFDNAINNNVPKEGNIIVAGPFFIKKK